MGLFRGLGPDAVLRLGGNTSERTAWRNTGNASAAQAFVITPAAIDALAAAFPILNYSIHLVGGRKGTSLPIAEAD